MFSTRSPGANELAVQKAKAEITRLIKEELIRLVSGNLRDFLFFLISVLLNYNSNSQRYTNERQSLMNLHQVISTLM